MDCGDGYVALFSHSNSKFIVVSSDDVNLASSTSEISSTPPEAGKLFPALVTLPFPGKTLDLPVYRPHVPHQVALGAELFAALVAGLAPLCLEMHAIFVFLEVFLAEE